MEARFIARRKQLLDGATIRPEVAEGLPERLAAFLEPYAKSIGRKERRVCLQTYLRGLLSDLERKNAESIAYLEDLDRKTIQHFLGTSRWDHEPMIERLCREVGQELGEQDGVLVFDPSGFKKCGRDSVGVARQWIGRYGKVENGQVGIYLGYVSRKGYALCDTRLFLPREWTNSRARCRKAGVPKEEMRFRTRHKRALEMLDARGSLLPHEWVTGDDEMGRSSEFRRELRARGERYLLAVPSNTTVRDLEAAPPAYGGRGARPKTPFISVDKLCKSLPDEAWKQVIVRDGEKAPLRVWVAKRRVYARTEKRGGSEELLVMARRREGRGWHTDYLLSNAAPDTPLEEFARVAKAEHRIEDLFKLAKSEAGLADYEVRTWRGWYHHQTLSMMATWFLVREALRGKKIHTCNHTGAGTGADDVCIARDSGEDESRMAIAHGTTASRAERERLFLPLCRTKYLASVAM